MQQELLTIGWTATVSSVLGWLGTFLYIMAYLLISFGKLKASRYGYHVLNALGAAGLIVHALYLNDGPNLICNLAWFTIALVAMVSITIRRLRKTK